MTNYICDCCGQWSDAERKLAELQKEIEEQRKIARTDPAEQRAERYALEATSLTERLIAAEHQLAEARQALKDIKSVTDRMHANSAWRDMGRIAKVVLAVDQEPPIDQLKADFKQRMEKALLVNEQRLDEIAGLRQDIRKAKLGDDYLG